MANRKRKLKYPGVKKKPTATAGRGNPTYVRGGLNKRAQKIAREFEERMRAIEDKEG